MTVSLPVIEKVGEIGVKGRCNARSLATANRTRVAFVVDPVKIFLTSDRIQVKCSAGQTPPVICPRGQTPKRRLAQMPPPVKSTHRSNAPSG